MSTEPNTTTQQPVEVERQNRRWARLGTLTVTMAGPAISAALARLLKQMETPTDAEVEAEQAGEADSRDLRTRLEELTQESRERVAQQILYLRSQARQFKAQSRQLSKAMRKEARQRRKLLKRAGEAGLDWSQEMLKRGEQLTGEAIERGGKVTHDLLEQGQDLTHDLAKRGRKVTRKIAKRGEQLLEPTREHSRIWAFVGFGVGMIVAGAITYRLVRTRAARQEAEDEPIVLVPTPAAEEEVEEQRHEAAEQQQSAVE